MNINQFIEYLKQIRHNFHWFINNNSLRCYSKCSTRTFCPLTACAFIASNKSYSVLDYIYAGMENNLDKLEVGEIAFASDNIDFQNELCDKLKLAVGIS